ncbi:JAB domain-containing protein [Runella aurantiaca]|uniref:DNA repair protein n=1 Tax=Runella aurantiaca TaxID=2282308 RepID=A0A369IDH2_9BACT|nr:JAB domain-containing protein [Runella aurantiaca]RDB07831.1 DNA repair protein [Runella aurantiaca]
MQKNETQSLYRVNEVEIVYRNKVPYQDRIQITQSETAYEILRQCWDENRIELVEQFKILLLDRRHTCLGVSDIATGGITGCVVDPRIVFATALKTKASALILAHNHPSGNLKPSEADIALTRKLLQGGKLLEISVIDHLIVTPYNYCSFADDGLMPG